jgi:hypothetical protein
MAFDAAIADRLLSRRRMGWSETIALALTVVAVALGAAAWITDFDQTTLTSAALPTNIDRISSFEDRFFPPSRIVFFLRRRHRPPATLPCSRRTIPPWLWWR